MRLTDLIVDLAERTAAMEVDRVDQVIVPASIEQQAHVPTDNLVAHLLPGAEIIELHERHWTGKTRRLFKFQISDSSL